VDILLNGDPRALPREATLVALIEDLDLAGKRVAVEVNEEIVPRSEYARRRLRDGDRVEIVHAIGGG